MKSLILKVSAIVTCALLVTGYTYANNSGQSPKVIVGKCISFENGEIKIEGSDGNIYLIEQSSVDSSITISDGAKSANVESRDGIGYIEVGSKIVVNISGVVLVEVSETPEKK